MRCGRPGPWALVLLLTSATASAVAGCGPDDAAAGHTSAPSSTGVPARAVGGTAAPSSGKATSTRAVPRYTEPAHRGGATVVLGRSFPSAATTGIPAGTVLTGYAGPCVVRTPGVVLDKVVVDCDLRILAPRVVIRNSLINGSVDSDPGDPGSFTITDSTIRAGTRTATGLGAARFVATRVEVSGGSRSVNCALDCTVRDSYVHGQYIDHRGLDHESGIRMGSGNLITHNTIACDSVNVPPDAGCSASLTGYGDTAAVQDNTIRGNLIRGADDHVASGYCAYGGSTAGKPFSADTNHIRFLDNVFVRGRSGICGVWGPITSFDVAAPGNVWQGNVFDDGTVVPAAN